MSSDYVGKLVSEEEVARDLGFATLDEYHRWQTEMGQKVDYLERELRSVKSDANWFQWSGKRMQIVLEIAEKMIQGIWDSLGSQQDRFQEVRKLLLAIRVVCGRDVDWKNELKDWFEE